MYPEKQTRELPAGGISPETQHGFHTVKTKKKEEREEVNFITSFTLSNILPQDLAVLSILRVGPSGHHFDEILLFPFKMGLCCVLKRYVRAAVCHKEWNKDKTIRNNCTCSLSQVASHVANVDGAPKKSREKCGLPLLIPEFDFQSSFLPASPALSHF